MNIHLVQTCISDRRLWAEICRVMNLGRAGNHNYTCRRHTRLCWDCVTHRNHRHMCCAEISKYPLHSKLVLQNYHGV